MSIDVKAGTPATRGVIIELSKHGRGGWKKGCGCDECWSAYSEARGRFLANMGGGRGKPGRTDTADPAEPTDVHIKEERRSADAPPAGSASVSTMPSGELVKGLTGLIAETGTLMAVVAPITGITTVNQAPATAAALAKIAEKNPLVKAALEKLVAGSGYYELIIAVYPIGVAFAYEWALPEDSALMPRAHKVLKRKVPELVPAHIPAEYVMPQHLPVSEGEEAPPRVGLLDGLDATG